VLLRERLESLGRPGRLRVPRAEADLEALAHGLHGEVRENDWGPYVVVEQMLPLPPALAWDPLEPGWLAGAPGEALDEQGLCFFDTETTGLNGGVGNHAFLVALGWRIGTSMLMRQYVLADPGLELPFLEAVAADIGASGALVSYNGKTFDVPVLEGRLLLSRRSADCLRRPHLDLLHPSRRLFKARLGACNLQNIEARVLGRDRGDDIPGFLIPETYFSYLRHRDPTVLREVLSHNRQDVVSLSLLLDHLVRCLRHDSAAHPLDRFGAARMLEAVVGTANPGRGPGRPSSWRTLSGCAWRRCTAVAAPPQRARRCCPGSGAATRGLGRQRSCSPSTWSTGARTARPPPRWWGRRSLRWRRSGTWHRARSAALKTCAGGR